ncbi:hypothetical protein AB0P28_15470 [Pseudarthrobacter sp. NPDC089323]|uniref:Uncharacterized protein n=1 Tax=Arthrobacter nitrophenolicus TaxID=683150 RepID=A0ACC6TJV0_9MICC
MRIRKAATAAVTAVVAAGTIASAVGGADKAPAQNTEPPKNEDPSANGTVAPSLCYATQEDGTGFCVDRSVCSGGCLHVDGTNAVQNRKWYELNS